MDIVVVGGGMAGARLAQQLASCGAARVTVIGEEPHRPYNRVLLADVLAGRYGPEVIALPGPLRAPRPRRAVRLDRARRRVLCDDGSAVRYDRLVLATGSNAVLPPLRGLFGVGSHELPRGVGAFRTLDDCAALAAATGGGTRAVVVGGGLLGVSAAQALAARGAQVVVVQQGEHLMERHLDAEAAGLLRGHLTEQGVEVHTECRARGVRTAPLPGAAREGGPRPAPRDPDRSTAGAAGRRVPVPGRAAGRAAARDRAVTAVELADGHLLEADVVVLACGVRPRTGLASAAGLPVERGVVVADDLRTADPAVFAIGDCAQHAGVVYGLAGAAREQADVLAAVLAAEAEAHAGTPPDGLHAGPDAMPYAGAPADHTAAAPRYRGTRALTRLTLRGRPASAAPGPSRPAEGEPPATFDVAAFGEPVGAAGDDVLRLADGTRRAYRKVVVRGDRLVGGILLGDLDAVGALARVWEGDEVLPASPLPLVHLLTNDGGL